MPLAALCVAAAAEPQQASQPQSEVVTRQSSETQSRWGPVEVSVARIPPVVPGSPLQVPYK